MSLHNKHWFTSTAGLAFSYRLMLDGAPFALEAGDEGWTSFEIPQILPQVGNKNPLDYNSLGCDFE